MSDKNDLWRPPTSPAPLRPVDVAKLDLPPPPKAGDFAQAIADLREGKAQKAAKKDGYSGVVTNSAEFSRIMMVPRRKLDLENTIDLTCIFRKEEGTMQLRPIQSAALIEAHFANGLFAPIGVGWGKTLITLLLPEAMDSKKSILLVPPQLRDQLNREIDELYGKNFNLPMDRIVQIVAYSELSLAKNTELLDRLEPDLIICDEVHNLARASSARTKRFTRYMRENPHCRLAALSGTMTNDSILNYAHILELALRKNSPLPNSHKELRGWSGALDVDPAIKMQPGALMQFCEEGENVRQGYRRRLVETCGVVATEEGAIGTSLLVREIQPEETPAEITDALAEVARTWAYNGEEYADPLAIWRFRRQMSCGFYYRWVWPDGEPDKEWLEARSNWKSAAREKVKLGRVGMDSEFLVASAAERWRKSVEDHSACRICVCDDDSDDDCQCIIDCKLYPEEPKYCTGVKKVRFGPDAKLFECEEWIPWIKVRSRYNPSPPTEAVWISKYLIHAALKKATGYWRNKRKVIIWYTHKVVGEALAEISGFKRYGEGADASIATDDIIICSTHTQGTGKNLQRYDTNIIISMLTSGKAFEQVAGRSHRPGQLSDEVLIDYFGHTEAFNNSMFDVIADALYIQDSTGQRQKILYASGERISQIRQEIEAREDDDRECPHCRETLQKFEENQEVEYLCEGCGGMFAAGVLKRVA